MAELAAGDLTATWLPEHGMTAPTHALVSGRGLRHVAPGDTFAATFTAACTPAGMD